MPTAIDESGDTGHAKDSLPYFRLAAIWMPSDAESNAFRESVRVLRSRLGLPRSYEFKFARTQPHPDRRKAFFDNALNFPFRFAVCAIDKEKGRWKTAPSREQHWAAATCLAVDLRSVYHSAEIPACPLREQIIVDDNGDKSFLKSIGVAFRGLRSRLHPSFPMTTNPRFRGSKADEVMHLVDMVCGATGAFIDGDPSWYDMVKERCVGLTRLP